MDYEYRRFGDGFVRREQDSTDDWQEVPESEREAAAITVGVAEELRRERRKNPPKLASTITRGEAHEKAAKALGLSDDELADRLARETHNEGTRKRVSEKEFDSLMAPLALSPQEARDRFSGKFWQG